MRLKRAQSQDSAMALALRPEENLLVQSMQEAITAGTPLALVPTLSGEIAREVYPHRLVFVDGELELIAEDCRGRYLRQYLVCDIAEAPQVPKVYRPTYFPHDIEQFLSAGRKVVGNEVRLVLKAVGDGPLDLNPPFHYFASPYTTVNGDGQIIWAASVELSGPLFEWLAGIRKSIQVLDPPLLEQELDLYIEFDRHKKD